MTFRNPVNNAASYRPVSENIRGGMLLDKEKYPSGNEPMPFNGNEQRKMLNLFNADSQLKETEQQIELLKELKYEDMPIYKEALDDGDDALHAKFKALEAKNKVIHGLVDSKDTIEARIHD